MVFNCQFVTFPLVSWVRCVLDLSIPDLCTRTYFDRSLNGEALGLVVSDTTVLKVWYLIVSSSDPCTLTHFVYIKENKKRQTGNADVYQGT